MEWDASTNKESELIRRGLWTSIRRDPGRTISIHDFNLSRVYLITRICNQQASLVQSNSVWQVEENGLFERWVRLDPMGTRRYTVRTTDRFDIADHWLTTHQHQTVRGLFLEDDPESEEGAAVCIPPSSLHEGGRSLI